MGIETVADDLIQRMRDTAKAARGKLIQRLRDWVGDAETELARLLPSVPRSEVSEWGRRMRDGDEAAEKDLEKRLHSEHAAAAWELVWHYHDEITDHIWYELRKLRRQKQPRQVKPAAEFNSDEESIFHSDVESIFHSAAVKFLARVNKGTFEAREAKQLRAFVKLVALSGIIDRVRREKSSRRMEGDQDQILEGLPGREPSPDQVVAENDEITQLLKLSEKDKQMLQLIREGYTFAEIAQQMNVQRNTPNVWMTRLRQRLLSLGKKGHRP